MKPIRIVVDRPFLELVRNGQTTRWEYDVLTLKIEAERLEAVHGLRERGSVKKPSVEFLADFAKFLVDQGLAECSIDTSMRIYSLVTVQFRQMSQSLTDQIAAMD